MNNISPLTFTTDLYEFSLRSTVTEFWAANGYFFAIMVYGLAGVWPFIKLLMMTICIFYPLKTKLRGVILLTIDAIGKYSFIDTLLITYMAAAFRVNVD
mmetsp:Transcript_95251/g.142739  ORF Transcript_95251/g.142739 Transcript_95251/m.142739 type:complete len:99 (+) Transcript_95251:287-583(+)